MRPSSESRRPCEDRRPPKHERPGRDGPGRKWSLRDRRGSRLLGDVAGADRVRERLLSLRVDGVIGKPFP
jgi:hypothetical protein